jgi:hypothetical protein
VFPECVSPAFWFNKLHEIFRGDTTASCVVTTRWSQPIELFVLSLVEPQVGAHIKNRSPYVPFNEF